MPSDTLSKGDMHSSSSSAATVNSHTQVEPPSSDLQNISQQKQPLKADLHSPVKNGGNNSVLSNLHSSSYRYTTGKFLHASKHFEDIRSLFYGLSGESNVLEGNDEHLALPLTGAGGRIAVLSTRKPGRMPPVMPALICSSEVCDFAMSKHIYDNHSLLVTASEDSKLRVWKIPVGESLSKDISQPVAVLNGHLNRVNMVQFHPRIRNLVLSCSIEQMALAGQMPTLRLWDLQLGDKNLSTSLGGFTDVVLGAAWDQGLGSNSLLATTCRDKIIRVFDARKGTVSHSTHGHEGIRSARPFFHHEHYLTSVGAGAGSVREMRMFDLRKFDQPLAVHTMDVSPSIFVPHFCIEENSQTGNNPNNSGIVFLCGRGDTGIQPVEINPADATSPFYLLPKFDAPDSSVQQGVVFIPRKRLDVANIEVARCWRLSQTSIAPVSFSVPRTRREYFQDDLFPPVRAEDDEPSMTASSWFSGSQIPVSKFVDLCPRGMKKLSEAPQEVKQPSKYSLGGSASKEIS